MWAVDRLHPSERGHRLIACRFHDQLAAAGVPTGPRPDPEPSSPPPSRAAEIGWLATKGTAWVLRRSTDLVPGLVAMALRECWPGPGPQPQVVPPLLLPEPVTAEPGPGPETGVPEIGVPEIGHAP